MRLALLAAAATVALLPALALPAAPATATTCPAGSVTFHTENDINGKQLVQNADNYGAGAITCFSDTGTAGQLTVTQADHSSNPVNPTSYPSDDYGCTATYCSAGWATQSWLPAGDPTPPKVNNNFSNTGVNSNDVYDYLIDTLFTDSSHLGTGPPVLGEVEVVINARPSYAAAGFCVSAACGATPVTINGFVWWRSFKTTSGGWPDTLYVKDSVASNAIGYNMWNFYHDANSLNNCSGAPCYTSLYISSLWAAGAEMWPRTAGDGGVGVKVNSASLVNVP